MKIKNFLTCLSLNKVKGYLTLKSLSAIIVPMMITFFMPAWASAYNVQNLPETMTLSEALTIGSADEITRMTVSDTNEGYYIDLDEEDTRAFFEAASGITLTRYINPTPFRGIAVNIYCGQRVNSYYLNSGVQLGLYGSGNYVCYKANDTDTINLMYIMSVYRDRTDKREGEVVHRQDTYDFLKLPSDGWAVAPIQAAAAKNLVPYELTSKYGENITREEFCILLGNLITVAGNYASLNDYMQERGIPYLKNTFVDCYNSDSTIDILYALGVVNGVNEHEFQPDNLLTREQAAKLLCTTAELFKACPRDERIPFIDSASVSGWAKQYVSWASGNWIMNGVGDNRFAPADGYTVQQAIATVSRLYDFINR